MRRLFVAGCSYSDYTTDMGIRPDLITPYGQRLAAQLGYEYWHEAAGCGSNYRIWRSITAHIMSGNLRPDDLLLIQYTEFTRQEFWTSLKTIARAAPAQPITDPGPDHGTIIRYKLGSAEWQANKKSKQFFQQYEENFVNKIWATQQWQFMHFNFQHMLIGRNIRTIFMNTRIFKEGCDELLDQFIPHVFVEDEDYILNTQTWLNPKDRYHLSQFGHSLVASQLYEHIKQVFPDIIN